MMKSKSYHLALVLSGAASLLLLLFAAACKGPSDEASTEDTGSSAGDAPPAPYIDIGGGTVVEPAD
jgi:hypothetical protein